jgi:hypothetical protein
VKLNTQYVKNNKIHFLGLIHRSSCNLKQFILCAH